MDHTVHSHNPDNDRAANNQLAWKNLTGYRTSSGCACWDRSYHLLIPKHAGWGYNVNFWCLLCCFVCQATAVTTLPENFESHQQSLAKAQHGSLRASSGHVITNQPIEPTNNETAVVAKENVTMNENVTLGEN
jgi:hypothetical protein